MLSSFVCRIQILIISILLNRDFKAVNCDVDVYSKILNPHNPLKPPSENVSVGIGLDLYEIIDLDIKKQISTVRAALHVYWKDPSLSWNQEEFPGMKSIQLLSTKIWTPNIVLWNLAESNYGTRRGGELLISQNGEIHLVINSIFKSVCTIDVTYYPFDQQICVMKFGTGDKGVQVQVHDNINYINLSEFYLSVIWGIVDVPGYQNRYVDDKTNEIHTDVTYYLTIKRYTYWIGQVYPLLALAFLTLLPIVVQRFTEKLFLQILCLVGLFVVYKDTADKLPQTTLVTPHVFNYMNVLIIINLFHVTLTCVISNFEEDQLSCLLRFIPTNFQKILCLTGKDRQVKIMPDSEEKESEITKSVEAKCATGGVEIGDILHRLILLFVFSGVLIATLHFLLAIPA